MMTLWVMFWGVTKFFFFLKLHVGSVLTKTLITNTYFKDLTCIVIKCKYYDFPFVSPLKFFLQWFSGDLDIPFFLLDLTSFSYSSMISSQDSCLVFIMTLETSNNFWSFPALDSSSALN